MRNKISDLLSLVGAGFISAAAFLITTWLGLVIVGIFLLVISYFMKE